jgi:hypothetical protein
MIPVSVDIKASDELIYILAELMQIEAHWKELREAMCRRWDFDSDYLSSLIPQGEYINEDKFIDFCSKVGISPSTRDIRLFMNRFSDRGKIDRVDFSRILMGRGEKTHKLPGPETTQPGTKEAAVKWLSALFAGLNAGEKLRQKFKERGTSLEEAFKLFGREAVDENLLRDKLLERNVLASSADLSNIVSIIGKDRVVFGIDELRRFMEPVERN